jgi:hypothetical protein
LGGTARNSLIQKASGLNVVLLKEGAASSVGEPQQKFHLLVYATFAVKNYLSKEVKSCLSRNGEQSSYVEEKQKRNRVRLQAALKSEVARDIG